MHYYNYILRNSDVLYFSLEIMKKERNNHNHLFTFCSSLCLPLKKISPQIFKWKEYMLNKKVKSCYQNYL